MPATAAHSFDHVALWVGEREPLTRLLCDHLGMHAVERGDDFTLLGADALEGKLTLFDAEPPRERGVLERVVLRVADLDTAEARLPRELATERGDGLVLFDAPEGLRLGLTEAPGLDYDLDHVVLRVSDPERTARDLEGLGFGRRDGGLGVADRRVLLERGGDSARERPLLNHLALLVDSADQVREEAERRGIEIERVVDAPNTFAVFVRGPDGFLVEYVEHKPEFSLT